MIKKLIDKIVDLYKDIRYRIFFLKQDELLDLLDERQLRENTLFTLRPMLEQVDLFNIGLKGQVIAHEGFNELSEARVTIGYLNNMGELCSFYIYADGSIVNLI